jgi:Cyclic nucleotide-binding domain
MHVHSSITALSWIPSEAVTGVTDASFKAGFTHYDQAPPDAIGPDIPATVEALRAADRFRFANHLGAEAIFDGDGRCVEARYTGAGTIGATTIRIGRHFTVAAVSLPDRQLPPEIGDGWVRFTQTSGGRTGLPAPRTVRRPPFVQLVAPIAWSTLELVLHADGRAEGRLVGASPFPRHWIYDGAGGLTAKTGMTDFRDWAARAFGRHTPWGDEDSPALVTAVETALERELSHVIMRGGAKPQIRRVRVDDYLTRQGDIGDELFLLLDGILAVEVDDVRWAEVGPGAVVGERAVVEGAARTSTLRAVTPCRVAAVRADQIDRAQLAALADGHRREERAAVD